MNDLSKVPTDVLRQVLKIREQKEKLDKEEARISGAKPIKPKPKLSKAARLVISKKIRARWAAARQAGRKRL